MISYLKKIYYVNAFLYLSRGTVIFLMIGAITEIGETILVFLATSLIVLSIAEVKRDWKKIEEALPKKISIMVDLEKESFKITPAPEKTDGNFYADRKILLELEY